MHTTITQTALDAIAPSLDPAAREMAHAECPADAADFVQEYIHALAHRLGVESAAMCRETDRDGAQWRPQSILPGDQEALDDAIEVLMVDPQSVDWDRIWRIYRDAA